MSKAKSRNTFRVLSLLLVVAMISTVMLSGTFAKYTSEYAGQDTALVAKWDFTVEVGDGTLDPEQETTQGLNLFEHAYDTNINPNDGEGTYIIAPGVGGEFVLDITNNSDVAADITFDIAKETGSADVPMQFKIDQSFDVTGESAAEIYENEQDLTTALNGLDIQLSELTGTTDITVYWRWAFDDATNSGSNDVTDTDLGVASAEEFNDGGSRTEYTLKVTVKATQVAPVVTPGN